ncbi:MAG TPA: FGGY-family carbohydrate kinase [Bryobacteraceae bacterium]|nr:FGGY-family carbohydrate kinase [Bryobacteraceae bacterium]
MAWICVDAGTSIIKAVGFDEDGHERALARETSATLSTQPGFAEQDMNAVWSTVLSAIRQVSRDLSGAVRGIAITAQGDGCWLVDAEGNPTGNAILWNDGRAGAVVDSWRESGVIEQAFRLSGSVAYPGLPNAILRWLEQNEPERIEKARWSLTCNGWLFSKLTGVFLADLSDGSNPFSAVMLKSYSPDLFRLYGLEHSAHLMPPIHTGAGLIAPLARAVAEQSGLPPGTPVIMAPYDIVSTAIGCGTIVPRQACAILGTTICAEVVTDAVDLSASPAGTTIALEGGNYLRAMPTLTGCEALAWAAKALSCGSIEELECLARSATAGSNGLLFLPYLSLAGERSPFLEPNARASFIGLSLGHTRADMARSVYEGLAFVIRECLEAAVGGLPSELRVCGGGARSDLWCQIIADATDIPIVRTEDNEVGARGAFLFALAATGNAASIAEAVRSHVAPARTFSPSAGKHALYRERFHLFLQQRALAVPQWRLYGSRA